MPLPSNPHPIVSAFSKSLQLNDSKHKGEKKTGLQKTLQVLGWRNRHSQAENYPIEIKSPKEYNFQVKQEQRGEVENTYGTGATVWPAALVLVKYLEHLVSQEGSTATKTFDGLMNIADFGAGTGVTSIAAALLFPGSFVLCTDGCDMVVELAKENVKNMSSKKCEKEEDDIVQVESSNILTTKYWWGDGTLKETLKNNKGSDAKFDVILVADCVLPKLYPIIPLIDGLDECMSQTSVAFCTYEHRYYPEYDPKVYFCQHAAKKGLKVEQIPTANQHPIYSVDDIEIWKITRDH